MVPGKLQQRWHRETYCHTTQKVNNLRKYAGEKANSKQRHKLIFSLSEAVGELEQRSMGSNEHRILFL